MSKRETCVISLRPPDTMKRSSTTEPPVSRWRPHKRYMRSWIERDLTYPNSVGSIHSSAVLSFIFTRFFAFSASVYVFHVEHCRCPLQNVGPPDGCSIRYMSPAADVEREIMATRQRVMLTPTIRLAGRTCWSERHQTSRLDVAWHSSAIASQHVASLPQKSLSDETVVGQMVENQRS